MVTPLQPRQLLLTLLKMAAKAGSAYIANCKRHNEARNRTRTSDPSGIFPTAERKPADRTAGPTRHLRGPTQSRKGHSWRYTTSELAGLKYQSLNTSCPTVEAYPRW